MVATLRRSVGPLAARPTMGRPVPQLGPDHHRWVVKFGRSAYVITYRVGKDRVVLLTVRHEREAPPEP
ncbi:type II toxin-antitoxin system RelE/ParE family toxin [Massilia sp. NR 4-1]|uniref:type II toxin-antitoxin system RelE/ParE family toxin n=1 Tax=Massilia sp. NR 4-1 TaxID=1678028 RepID=UPI00168142AD